MLIRIFQTTILAFCLFGFASTAFAQDSVPLSGDGTCPDGYIMISAPAPGQNPCLEQRTAFPQWVSTVYNLAITLSIILATIMTIYGGYKYMTSSGNPDAIAEAKDIITGALIGLVLLVLAALLLRTISPSIVSY